MPRKKHNVVPELEPLLVPIDSVAQHPDNARRGDVEFLKAKLEEFGQYQVMVADAEGLLAVGNHRWQAAKALGWTHVACVRRDLDQATARRLRIADNAASDRATNDEAQLLDELNRIVAEAQAGLDDQEIPAAGASALAGVGFDQMTIDGLARAVNGRQTGEPATPPGEFADPEAGMRTDYRCPHCEYEWSGNPKPTEKVEA